MPKIKTISRPAGDTSPANPPSAAAPERRPADPLGWQLGGATPPQRPVAGGAERRREPAPRPHAAVDVRRRRSPSSRFRG